MRIPMLRKLPVTFLCLACGGIFPGAPWAEAQPYSASRALRPLTKDGVIAQPGAQNPPPAPRAPAAAPGKPAEIVAKIEEGLAASKINVIGRVDGLKGTMYVTNLSPHAISPLAQFVVCDHNGAQIGSVSKGGPALAPGEAEKIEVLATNRNAVDLKLFKLTGSSKK